MLEATSQVNTVVFDKTGTLTQGRPCLQAALPLPGSPFTPQLLLAYAAAVERCTTHPVAQAIVHAASGTGELPALGAVPAVPALPALPAVPTVPALPAFPHCLA